MISVWRICQRDGLPPDLQLILCSTYFLPKSGLWEQMNFWKFFKARIALFFSYFVCVFLIFLFNYLKKFFLILLCYPFWSNTLEGLLPTIWKSTHWKGIIGLTGGGERGRRQSRGREGTFHLQARILNIQKTCISPGTGMEVGWGQHTQSIFFYLFYPVSL